MYGAMNAASTTQDSPYAWFRLAVSLALATIGGIGIWSGIVVLPFIEVARSTLTAPAPRSPTP